MSIKLQPEKPVESLNLDFEVPQPGASILQFEEGVALYTNENSGKTSLRLPLMIDRVIEGPESNVGLKLTHFVPIESDFGAKQIVAILDITGLTSAFASKLGTEFEATSERFINALKLKLPGKFIKAQHSVRKDNNGKDRTNINGFEKVNKVNDVVKPVASSKAEEENSDW
jgi:hypothetical protein